MYISHQAQQAIHQDIVNDGLRRSEQRRMLKEQESGTQARDWNPTTTLTVLVRSLRSVVVRP
ncbi:MAG TPA: hypothetical protein VF898_12115 [Chloroflexota bacterium]